MAEELNQQLYPTDKGLNKADGADINAKTALTAAFWIDEMKWDKNIWTLQNGKLPTLT